MISLIILIAPPGFSSVGTDSENAEINFIGFNFVDFQLVL